MLIFAMFNINYLIFNNYLIKCLIIALLMLVLRKQSKQEKAMPCNNRDDLL